MKPSKILLSLAIITLGFVAVSCDDDDDIDYTQPTVVADMEFDFDDDILQLCDVQLHSVSLDGVESTSQLTAGDWNQRMQSSQFPCTCKFNFVMTKKPNVTLTQKTYDLDFTVDFEATGYNNGTKGYTIIPDKEQVVYNRENVPAAQVDAAVDELIQAVNALNYDYTFVMSDNKIQLKR